MNLTRLASSFRVSGPASAAICTSGGVLTALLLVGSLGACDSGGDGSGSSSSSSGEESESGDPDPVPTEAICDAESDLTYENFGAQFMDDYCTLCHISTAMGEDRFDAPLDKNYDTVLDVRNHAADIDAWAGSFGEITNTLMPPPGGVSLPYPPLADREKLSIWLACGAP